MSTGDVGPDVIDASPGTTRRETAGPIGRALDSALGVVSSVTEAVVSRRALCAIYLLVAAACATAGWLQPPLSRNIRSVHIPIGIIAHEDYPPEVILHGPRRIPLDSSGMVMVVAIVAGAVVVVLRPNRLGVVAGILLCLSIGLSAATALNHPILTELMDQEFEQRQDMKSALISYSEIAVVRPGAARIRSGPDRNLPLGPAVRGFDYLLYGQWLMIWTLAGVLFCARGRLLRRLRVAGTWALAGLLLTTLLCFGRLRAEYYGVQAEHLQVRGDAVGARRAYGEAVASCPDFGRLRRAWLFEGMLDHHEGRQTPKRSFFRAHQLSLNGKSVAALDILQSIPETIAHQPTVRNEIARQLTLRGVKSYQRDDLAAAEQAFRTARKLRPRGFDTAFYLGMIQVRQNPLVPEKVEAHFLPILDALADRVLRADILATIGDAYFEAGRFGEARARYRESFRAFNLPKRINYRAQHGLMGM